MWDQLCISPFGLMSIIEANRPLQKKEYREIWFITLNVKVTARLFNWKIKLSNVGLEGI